MIRPMANIQEVDKPISQQLDPNVTWYRHFVRGKTRIALAWFFAAILVFSAREFPSWPGILLCFFGATIRYWASGYLRKDSRPAVGGPYAWTRNPLYLGTYLMALGTAMAIHNWWLFGFVTVLYASIYHYIILDEETKLVQIFGEPYLKYCEAVPRFFPGIGPAARDKLLIVNPDLEHHKFSHPLANKNKAYEAYAAFAALIGFVWLIAWAWQRFAA
jgi:protein-S-isoprenylcysteine O-methyltransferase Ste14